MDYGQELSGSLVPANVQVIEFWVIVLILALFTLAVGPADYIVLGILRQRKLTWILFPAVAIAFTLATVAIAERYMGRTDQRRSLVVVDVDAQGRVLRMTSLEQAFLARERTVTEEVDSQLLWPVHRNKLKRGSEGYPEPDDDSAPADFIGRIPQRYTLQRRIHQWKAELARRTVIPEPDAPYAKPKHTIPWPAEGTAPESITPESILSGLPAGSSVILYHRTSGASVQIQNLSHTANRNETPWLHELTARRDKGYFRLVSQVSPNGGETLEDLTILDPSDSKHWVLAVVVPDEDDTYVYRRMYRIASP